MLNRIFHSTLTKKSGFTIIEIVVIVIIVCILAAVIFPRFIDVENKTRRVAVEENMKIVQMAAEAYAANNDGDFPHSAEDPAFKSYFPGGNCNSKKPEGGNYPENPFTHLAEAPLQGNITDVAQARQSVPPDLGGARVAGKIFYNALIPVGEDKATGYAIEGAGKNGFALTGSQPNSTYVLSNL